MTAGLLFAGLAASQPAAAADGDGRFTGHGWAVAPCSELIAALESEDGPGRPLFVGWVAGYLTGANVYMDDTFDIAPLTPVELVAEEVANVCNDNPDAAVVEVMVAAADQLAQQRLRSGRPMLALEHDGREVRIHREILRRTQGALKELGQYAGGLDGTYGPQTRAALTAFQEERGLPTTGLPDQRTLLALFFNIDPGERGGG